MADMEKISAALEGALRLIPELVAEIERLRVALAELVACHTESAGWSMSMLENRDEFDAMLNRNQERVESAVGAALAALEVRDK